jgi:hypothetical protein
MITTEDYLFFVHEAVDAMVQVVESLGDDVACLRPDIASVNSPYVILTHCLGVMERWGGQVVAGRNTNGERNAEFNASGSVAEIVARTLRAKEQLASDLALLDPYQPPRGLVDPDDASLPIGSSQGGALMHLYSELAIHRGHMEVCRDLLVSGAVATTSAPALEQPDSRYPTM